MGQLIDYSRFTGTAESSEVARQRDPRREAMSQTDKERCPDSFQRAQERERSDSSWAGSSMGGGTYAGRMR